MPRYFIHIDELDTDPEGTELPDLDAALREARLAAREMLAASIKQGRDDVPLLFFIADEGGRVLKTVHITEALPKMLLNGHTYNAGYVR